MAKKIFLLLVFSALFLFGTKAQNCQAYFAYSSTGNAFQFLDSSFFNSGNPNYYWTFGDGDSSSLASPSHVYSQAGNYTVCLNLSTTTGCLSTYCDTITAPSQMQCAADFSYFRQTGNQVAFSNQSTGSPAPLTYSWNFGDNTSSTAFNPIHNYASPGLYVVSLSVSTSNGQTCSKMDTVYVNSCGASFVSIPGQNGAFSFINSSLASPKTFYRWQFGDGSPDAYTKNTNHVYSNAGSYLVSLFLYDSLDNCSSTFVDSIYSSGLPNCQAGFTSTINQGQVSFQNTATSFTSLIYDFGDGTSSSALNPIHNYQQSGTYVVCQSIVDSLSSCTDVFCDSIQVTVPPPCRAGFNYTQNLGTVSISNTAQNSTSIFYDFGDGTSSSNPNPIHMYSQSGSYVICQTVSNSSACSDSFCDTVIVNVPPACLADFVYSIQDDTLIIQNLALQADSIQYDFGDGNLSKNPNPSHIYAQSGTYLVCQQVSNSLGCIDTYCDTIQIVIPDPCTAGFETNQLGDSVYFINRASNFTAVQYDFGDGNSSNQLNPIHYYSNSGTYVVTQTVSNAVRNCSDTFVDTLQINVSTSCLARFQIAIDTNNMGTLYLVNTSSNDPSHSYHWDFGDGSTDSGRLPSHRYQNYGAHVVCLTIVDTLMNCSSSYCDTIGLDSNGNLVKSSGYFLKVLEGDFIGLEEDKKTTDALEVYPNPFDQSFQIQSAKSYPNFRVFNLKGQLIVQGVLENSRVFLPDIPGGVYLLELSGRGGIIRKKIIKQAQ